jgi:hypothetical protein
MSLGIDSSTLKIPYGSCCLDSFCNKGFNPVSALKLLELKEGLFIDLKMGPDFSSSIALDVLSSLVYMTFKHFMMLSDSLLGCHCWFSSSNGDFGGRSEIIGVFRSFG